MSTRAVAGLIVALVAIHARAQLIGFSAVDEMVPSGAGPVIGTGDFDGDGDIDLLTNGTGVYLNDGNGRFTAHPVLSAIALNPYGSVSSRPQVVVGDITGDQLPDVICWSGGGPGPGAAVAVQKWINQGGGVLVQVMAGVPGSVGYVRDMALGDVDNDGDLDLALAVASAGLWGAMGAGTPKLWLNNGAGAFTSAPSQFPLVLSMPQQLALEDFDLDGDLDLLLVGAASLGVPATRWLSLNNGAGFFGPAIVLGTGVPYEICATGDVNGDGLRDIAFDARVSFATAALTTILINAGGGTFTPMPSTAVPGLPATPLLIDLDGNGQDDLVRIKRNGCDFHLLGGGTITAPASSAAVFPAAQLVWSNADEILFESVANLDGDSDFDVVVFTGQGNRVLFNDGAGSLREVPGRLSLPQAPSWALLGTGDYEGDGDADLIYWGAAHSGGVGAFGGEIYCGVNDGTGRLSWSPPALATPTPTNCVVTFFDIDLDSDVDAYFGGFGSASHQVFLNNGGVFTPLPAVPVPLNTVGFAVADFDGDGDFDVAACGQIGNPYGSPPTGVILLNAGGGAFVVGSVTPVPLYPRAVAVDVDGDLDVDLVSGSGAVLLNNGAGVFSIGSMLPSAGAVAAGDLDLDGDADLVLGSAVFRNNGAGVFSPWGSLPVPPVAPGGPCSAGPSDLALLDVDEDGDLDVVDTCGRVYANLGNGTFAAPILLGHNLLGAVAHADFDGDGDQDLVADGPKILCNLTRQLARGLPARPGRPASLDLAGLPGAPWLLFAAAGPANLSLPPHGTVFIDLATAFLAASGAFSANGTSTLTVTLPPSPSIVGLSAYCQAATLSLPGLRLTGLEVVTVMPY